MYYNVKIKFANFGHLLIKSFIISVLQLNYYNFETLFLTVKELVSLTRYDHSFPNKKINLWGTS